MEGRGEDDTAQIRNFEDARGPADPGERRGDECTGPPAATGVQVERNGLKSELSLKLCKTRQFAAKSFEPKHISTNYLAVKLCPFQRV